MGARPTLEEERHRIAAQLVAGGSRDGGFLPGDRATFRPSTSIRWSWCVLRALESSRCASATFPGSGRKWTLEKMRAPTGPLGGEGDTVPLATGGARRVRCLAGEDRVQIGLSACHRAAKDCRISSSAYPAGRSSWADVMVRYSRGARSIISVPAHERPSRARSLSRR